MATDASRDLPGATTPPEGIGAAPWRDPQVVSQNREPVLPAGWVPCPDRRTARRTSPPGGPRREPGPGSPWWIPLDGTWDFELLGRPEELTSAHLVPGERTAEVSGARTAEVSGARTAEVPGAWTVQGLGAEVGEGPIYTNVVMPFAGEPPHVPEENPTAVYRRRVEVPEDWESRRVVLRVGSAESVLLVYLDGAFIGYGTDSRLPSDFDLSGHCTPGSTHDLALVVPRWSAQTWLEDQDQWFHGGLQRGVALFSTATTHVSTLQLTSGLARLPRRPGSVTTGTLEVDLLVEGPGCTEPGWTAEVAVETVRGSPMATTGRMEVPHWDDSDMFLQNAGAMFTDPGRVRTTLEVPQVTPWSAEQPELYRAVVVLRGPRSQVVEVGALLVGFRQVEVRDRQLLINGAPVVLRGVNLHEHDPLGGRAVSRAHTRADLLMLKAANLNAVRGAHYPHAEHFAELCDELGLYVVDEANVESHARQWSLCHDRRFDASVIERVSRMARRDSHHASVIMWSLGNEAGYGAAHDAAAGWLRRFDPSRPLHYEGPFMYDLDAEAPVSDVVCPMYTTVADIVDWAQRAEDPRRPLILCEYSHAMGNACGGLADYDEAFESHEGLQGGFIWEWCEHGIPTPDGATGPSGAPSWGYGGDFGDDPAEGNFVLDGLVGADRNPHPVLDEVRHLGRPVRSRLLTAGPGRAEVELTNQRWFTDTSDLLGTWELTLDGTAVGSGDMPHRPLAPREANRKVIRWRRQLHDRALRAGGELHLTICWRRSVAVAWGGEGSLVAREQYDLTGYMGDGADPVAPGSRRPAPVPTGGLGGATVQLGGRDGGVLSGFSPLVFTPTVFRALTDNDGIRVGWMRGLNGSLARWVDDLGLDRCSWDPDEGVLQPASAVPPVTVRARLVDAPGAWLGLRVAFELPEELADPPRLGLVWELPAALEHLEFFADGPSDCYPDRRAGTTASRWRSTVSEQYVDYGMPQEHGHHTGLRWVALRSTRNGPGLLVVADGVSADGPRPGFSARHHSDEELWNARHTSDLAALGAATATYLSVDVAQRGLGQGSLGPEPAPQYRLDAGRHELELLLHPITGTRGGFPDPAELYSRRPRR